MKLTNTTERPKGKPTGDGDAIFIALCSDHWCDSNVHCTCTVSNLAVHLWQCLVESSAVNVKMVFLAVMNSNKP
eukprot:6495385-Ditylum_brightwellii.AAC.1